MTKMEFFDRLRANLGGRADVNEIIADLNEYFNEGLQFGLTEEQICDHLGDPADLAKEYESLNTNPAGRYERRNERSGISAAGTSRTEYEGIVSLYVNVVDCDVEIALHEGKTTQVDIRDTAENEDNRIYVTVENGVLSIRQQKRSVIGWLSGWNTRERSKASIRLPDSLLESIEASTVNGSLVAHGAKSRTGIYKTVNGSVEGRNLTAKRLELTTVNGKVTGSDLTGPSQKHSSVNGKVDVENINGEDVSISTVNGKVLGTNIRAAAVQLKSVNGKADLEGCECAELNISTVNGKVYAREAGTGKGSFKSVSGGIDVELQKCGAALLSSSSGSVYFKCLTPADINANATSGSLSLELPPQMAMTIHTSTLSGGVSVGFNSTHTGDKRRRTYTVGGGGSTLRLSTTSGSIRVNPIQG